METPKNWNVASSRRGVVGQGTWNPRGGPHVGSVAGGGGPVANAIREEGQEGFGGQAPSRTPPETLAGPAKVAVAVVNEGTPSPRLQDRSVDPAPYSRGDPRAARRSLRPVSRVANPKRPGMECAEARTSRPRARRAGHPTVAQGRLAADKKNAKYGS